MTTGRGELVFDMPREKYDRIQRVNFSTLKHMGKSPAHYLEASTHAAPDTAPKKVGRASHLACWEPERFRASIAVWEEGRPRRGKDWEAFKRRNEGLELLTPAEHEQCLVIQKAVRASKLAEPFISGGKGEVSVLWTHETPAIGGLPGFSTECKSRLDFLANCRAVVDLKTAADASEAAFTRQAWNLGYYVQAAFYVDALEAATGQRWPYYAVVVEAKRPYPVQVFRVSDMYLDMGREEYRRLLQRLHECRADSRWPAYSEQVLELGPPRWASPFSSSDEDVTGLGLDFSEAGAT